MADPDAAFYEVPSPIVYSLDPMPKKLVTFVEELFVIKHSFYQSSWDLPVDRVHAFDTFNQTLEKPGNFKKKEMSKKKFF